MTQDDRRSVKSFAYVSVPAQDFRNYSARAETTRTCSCNVLLCRYIIHSSACHVVPSVSPFSNNRIYDRWFTLFALEVQQTTLRLPTSLMDLCGWRESSRCWGIYAVLTKSRVFRWVPNPVSDEQAFKAIKEGVDAAKGAKIYLNSGKGSDPAVL